MKTILFACIHNAGRSQMAAAFFNKFADPSLAQAISAGTEPAVKVHPEVVTSMREQGLDLAQAKPQLLTPELAAGTDLLVTMGCGESCPVVPGLVREDWEIPDPKGQPGDRIAEIREEIRRRVWEAQQLPSRTMHAGQSLFSVHWGVPLPVSGRLALKLVVLLIASTSFSGDVFSGSNFAQAQFLR